MTVGRIRRRRHGHGCTTAAEARDTQRDCTRHLQTTATLAVDEESEEGDVYEVEWDCGLNGAGDEDDDILGMGWESAAQTKYERSAAVVGSGAAENVSPTDACSRVKLSATRRSEAGIGFRGVGKKRIRNHDERKLKVFMTDGHVAGSTWQVADVKRPLMSVAKMVAAGNCVHLDRKYPRTVRPKGDFIPLRKAGNVFVIDVQVMKDATKVFTSRP